MKDEDLSRDELLAELAGLRRRLEDCELSLGPPIKHRLGDKEDHLRETSHGDEAPMRQVPLEDPETQEDYRSVVQGASEAICITHDGLLKFANRAGTELTGYSEEELLSMAFAALVHPEDLKELIRIYVMRLRGEYVPPGHRFRIITKAGAVKWVESWSASITWSGRPAVLSMIRDVTANVQEEERARSAHDELDRRMKERTIELQESNELLILEAREREQAELSVRESEDRFRRLMEYSPMGIAVASTSGEVEYLNNKFIELFGYTLSDIPTLEHWWHLAYPDPQYRERIKSEWFQATLESLEKSTEVEPTERAVRCKDGKIRFVDFRRTVTDKWLIHTLHDVTDKKLQEEALLESEQMFRLLSEQSLLSVAILQDGVYKYSNQAMADLCEYSLEEILNWEPEEFLALVHPADRALVMEQARMKQMGDVSQRTKYEFRIITKTGLTKWVEIYSKTIQFKGSPANLLTMLDITERKNAEEARRKSENIYRSLVETSPDPIIMYDLEGNLITVNRQAATKYGVDSPAQLLSEVKNVSDILDEKSQARAAKNLKMIVAEGSSRKSEYTVVRKDGGTLAVEINSSMVRNAADAPVGFISVIRDITDRKRSEKALFNSRQMLRSVLDTIPQRVFWKDRDSVYVGCNKPLALDCGYEDPDELVGKTDYETASAATAQIYRADDREVMETGKPKLDYEEPQFKPDGTVGWLMTSKVPMYDQDGRVIGVLGTYEDITERKRAEEALKESEERYRTLFEESMDGVYSVQRDGEITDANRSFCELFGYTREEMIGKDIRELYFDSAERSKPQEEIEKRGFLKDYEIKFRKKDGTEIDCLLTSSVYFGRDGSIAGYRGIVRDLTIRKDLRKQLLQAQKMEAIGTLAGGMAHDFNNLLQAILGYSDILLLNKSADDPDRKKLTVIQHAARDGADLVSRILMFSRKGESKIRPISLNDEIRRVEKLLRRTLPRMIQINLMLDGDLRIADADPAQLEQVILNLGVNAQHAMPNGGRLMIETNNVSLSDEYLRTHLGAKEGKYVLLTVSDTGIGMEPAVLERIFEPFFTTKPNGLGTGLGLSMVHGIVTQHGGYIRCYSEPGRGTSFKIYLPVSETELAFDPTLTREMPAFGTETILLVDDDDRIREMGKQMIEMGGYEVLVAKSGEETLEIYSTCKEQIALVILDLIMPGMGGSRCLEELLRMDPNVKVLVASGYSSNGFTHDHKGRGARGFVNKPYDAKDILTAIRRVLDKGTL